MCRANYTEKASLAQHQMLKEVIMVVLLEVWEKHSEQNKCSQHTASRAAELVQVTHSTWQSRDRAVERSSLYKHG